MQNGMNVDEVETNARASCAGGCAGGARRRRWGRGQGLALGVAAAAAGLLFGAKASADCGKLACNQLGEITITGAQCIAAAMGDGDEYFMSREDCEDSGLTYRFKPAAPLGVQLKLVGKSNGVESDLATSSDGSSVAVDALELVSTFKLDCAGEGRTTVSLSFSYNDGVTEQTGVCPVSIIVDFERPEPPTISAVKPGDSKLILSYDYAGGEPDDIETYHFYCDPQGAAAKILPGVGGAGGGLGGTGGGLGAGGGFGGAGGGFGGAGGGFGGAGAGAGGKSGVGGSTSTMSGDASSSAGDGATSGTPIEGECPESVTLTPGDIPDATYVECGSSGAKSGDATDLKNGVPYAVFVAAEDKYGNIGPLSEYACGSPEDVVTFWDQTTTPGGCGFCSFTATSDASWAGMAAGSLAAVVLLARRAGRRRIGRAGSVRAGGSDRGSK
jgi:hypothetical protein